MTQEEKQLLLIDLCARLSYGVIVQQSPKYIKGDVGYDIANKSEKEPKDFNIIGIEGSNCLITDKKVVENTYSKGKVSTPVTICIYNAWTKQTARPYLRPIHKLTKEELEELEFLTDSDYVDYCNEHHIDYRGLIEKGLALEAPADMYHITNLDVVDTVDDIMYDIDSDNVEVIYKSGKKTLHNIESLKLISSDERELGTEHDYLIEPNIHVVFYPEGHLSTFYFDE